MINTNYKYIKSFGEVNQNTGILSVFVKFQFYSPELSKDFFKSNVNLYKKYINKLFKKENIELFLLPGFRILKTRGYEFKNIEFNNNKKLGDIFNSFEKIYELSEFSLQFDIIFFEETQFFGNIKIEKYDSIINDISKNFDDFLEQLQKTENYKIMFVPNEISFVRSERKITTFNTLAKINQLGLSIKI